VRTLTHITDKPQGYFTMEKTTNGDIRLYFNGAYHSCNLRICDVIAFSKASSENFLRRQPDYGART
jgi:hypothetical protein